jgi:DNA-binding NarL/FixJ family response regulator
METDRPIQPAATIEVGLEASSGGPGHGGVVAQREVEILRLVAQGLSNQEIATRLVLSKHTVHRHVSRILTKLDLPSRAAAAAYAAQQGLL